MEIYVVKQGDTLYGIANKFNTTVEKIVSDNELTHPNELVVGQTIVILRNDVNYTVKQGDTLYKIATQFGITLDALLSANPSISNPLNLQVGENILVPLSQPKMGEIEVNGYCFVNINREVLRKTLPSLTYLSIFSYEVLPDGGIVNIASDQPIIDLAREQKVAPMMVITNLEENSGFSSELGSAILNNPQARQNLINNVINKIQQKNYFGVDIDFEYLYPTDREAYNNFVQEMVNALHPLGYIVTTALAPKTSADQQGILYEAHDYNFHGRTADHVILMTYEWGYTYGPPMAVAPANQVKKVLEYAVTEIPSNKILMGMPNYGYDWALPFVEGSAAASISNVGAVDLARKVGSFIKFDELQKAPYFNYYSGENEHVVWFEDANSTYARLKFVSDFNLGGVSYWTINQYFPQNWLVLNAMYDVKKLL